MYVHPSCKGPVMVAVAVEGALSPHPSRYRRRAAEAALSPYTRYTVQIPQPWPEASIPWEVRLSPDHGAWLRRLQGDGLELVLQTQIPVLTEPVREKFGVEFTVASIDVLGGEVIYLSNDRPLLWVMPKSLVEAARVAYIRSAAADRNAFGWPTMLIETDEYTGIIPAEMEQADAWLAEMRELVRT